MSQNQRFEAADGDAVVLERTDDGVFIGIDADNVSVGPIPHDERIRLAAALVRGTSHRVVPAEIAEARAADLEQMIETRQIRDGDLLLLRGPEGAWTMHEMAGIGKALGAFVHGHVAIMDCSGDRDIDVVKARVAGLQSIEYAIEAMGRVTGDNAPRPNIDLLEPTMNAICASIMDTLVFLRAGLLEMAAAATPAPEADGTMSGRGSMGGDA